VFEGVQAFEDHPRRIAASGTEARDEVARHGLLGG